MTGAARTGAPIVTFDGVGKSYRGVAALRDIDLAIAPGSCLALVGHNGAGKTTLIKLMLGLIVPTAGRVTAFGRDPFGRGHDAVARRIGFLPESVAFPTAMTGYELLRYYARLRGLGPDAVAAGLATVGLADAAGRRIKTYSKGMRQRLGLAQALLGEPELLVLDEPTTGLDPDLRRTFYCLIDARRAAGTAVVLSSHALRELESHIDRVAVLRDGALAAEGTLEALRERAGLPARIRVAMKAASAVALTRGMPDVTVTPLNGRRVEFVCAPARKMALVRLIAGDGAAVEDIEIAPPDLDQIYGYFRADAEAET